MLCGRSSVAVVTGLLLVWTCQALALANQFAETGFTEKRAPMAWAPTVSTATLPEGDDFDHALVVPQLPFAETGSTCGFHDDVLAPCTFLGGAPDVIYAYTPATHTVVDVDLCQSGFDTALHVYSGSGHDFVACSDDACGNGARIAGLELAGGVRYFFVVDGWYGGCGTYALSIVTDSLPCPVEIPAAAVPEGEPDCRRDEYDSYNRGCNDFPYAFTHLTLGDTELVVHGTYGTFPYFSDDFRDTDWYELEFEAAELLECSVVGGATTQLAILDGRQGCEAWSVVCGPVLGAACEPLECRMPVEPGRYWVFVATRWFSGVRCGTPYVLRLRFSPGRPVSAAPASWGAVKSLYR